MNEQDILKRVRMLELKVQQIELQAELQRITANKPHQLDNMFVGPGKYLEGENLYG